MTAAISTEENILEAARKVFMQKGFAAARMCDIAKTADINQALLHYYFRSKDRLFAVIFDQESSKFHSNLLSIIHSELSFFEKLRLIIQQEMQKITSAPYLPMFILNEMHSNPDRLDQPSGFGQRQRQLFQAFSDLVVQEQKAGNIRPVCPKQLFLTIHGLTMFPFLAQPMMKLTMNMDQQAFEKLISERVHYAVDMLTRSLQL